MDDGIIGADDSYAFVGADVLVGTTDVCVRHTMGGRTRIQRSPERAFDVVRFNDAAFRGIRVFGFGFGFVVIVVNNAPAPDAGPGI